MRKLTVIATTLVALLIPAMASASGAWHNQIRNRPTVLAASGDGSWTYTHLHWTTFYRDGEIAVARGHTYARVCWTWCQTRADIGPVTLTFAGVNTHNRWEAVKVKTGVYSYWRRQHCYHTNQPEGVVGQTICERGFRPTVSYDFLGGLYVSQESGEFPYEFFPCGTTNARIFNDYLHGGWPYKYITKDSDGGCHGANSPY